MSKKETLPTAVKIGRDHRVDVAEKKRLVMRARLLNATMRVVSNHALKMPTIDDVIREAGVSRGTFYNYFTSLEDVLVVIGHDLSNQMTTEILPLYDTLVEPWQRFSVGFRVFLVRAVFDRNWASFMTRTDAWTQDVLVHKYMFQDLINGKAAGQFFFEDTQVATDFLKGASALGIHSLLHGVADPVAYIDSAVRMAFVSQGSSREQSDVGVAFSSTYLKAWLRGDLPAARPQWALNMTTKERKSFL
jgi:AcrR family transcriptional regulator